MAAIVAAAPVSAIASNTDIASETVAACQSITDMATLTDAVITIGWTPSVPADLDDRAIQSYAATLLSDQFGFGDVPDPRIAKTWELALKNAAGVRNLKIVDGTQKKDRWFVLEHSGSILRVDSFEHETFGQVNCVIALKDRDSPVSFQKLLGDSGRDPQKLPPVYRLRPQSFESDGLKRNLNGAILNTERISAVSGTEVDVSSVYSSYVVTQPEKSE